MFVDLTGQQLADLSEGELYEGLYQILAASIEEDWDSGSLKFTIMAPDVHRYGVTASKGDRGFFGSVPRPGRRDARVLFSELARRMIEAGHPPWNVATFSCTHDGEMKLQLNYPDELD